MIITTASKSGKKAREPRWWGEFFEYYYPDVSLGIIEKLALEKEWAADFIKSLPSKCPFERQFWIGETLIMFVPALCRFNPLFRQLMRLKVKLLSTTEENSSEKIKNSVDNFIPPVL